MNDYIIIVIHVGVKKGIHFRQYHAVLWIWIVYAGSRIQIFPSRILDPGSRIKRSRIRSRIKEFKYFYPNNLFLSSRKNVLGCSSWTPDPGVKKHRIQGSKSTGSRILDPNPQHWYHGYWILIPNADANPWIQHSAKSRRIAISHGSGSVTLL